MMENPGPEDENIIKDMRNLFGLEKEIKIIKDRILRHIKNTFEHEEEYYDKPVISKVAIILNTNVTTIEIKHCQLRNTLIKLVHV